MTSTASDETSEAPSGDAQERPVRVRVAPSPTGDPHVGTAYQALFNYAYAKRHGGQFVLRIEDTDQLRSRRESETAILESLRWLGLSWDEGPDVGGASGPYRQSERLETYREHVQLLLERGLAYRDFSTREELEALRVAQRESDGQAGDERYDQRYRSLDPDESAKRAAAGDEHTVRLLVPDAGDCEWRDELRGATSREWSLIDDQILLKSDGFPTYHLANVVDDHLMGITDVIRGEEWMNSVPKHLLLYQGFGWEPPRFHHLPLLRNNDRSKLSKRKNPTSINYYRRAGFLPQALVNFLGLMGVSQSEGEEKLDLDALIERFDLSNISLGGPVFDTEKLRWLNARYIREDYDAAGLVELLRDWAMSDAELERMAPLAQPRLETLSDWGELTVHFFTDDVQPPESELTLKGREPSDLAEIFQLSIWRIEGLARLDATAARELLSGLASEHDLKLRDLTRPFYVAISGKPASTPLFETIEILGSDMVRRRLRRALDALGGLSKKKLKKLEKRHAAS